MGLPGFGYYFWSSTALTRSMDNASSWLQRSVLPSSSFFSNNQYDPGVLHVYFHPASLRKFLSSESSFSFIFSSFSSFSSLFIMFLLVFILVVCVS